MKSPWTWSTVCAVLLAGGLSPVAAQPDLAEKSVRPSDPAGTLAATVQGHANQRLFLPLKHTEVYLELTAGLVEATVVQSFINDTEYPLEAIYCFPLPSRATILDMELRVGNRVIRSVVQERAEAQKTYEAAKKAGKKAALMEQERPNIFTTSVANFLPGEIVEIVFRYLEPVTYHDGAYEVAFPMVIGPRYIPFNSQRSQEGETLVPAVADAPRILPPYLHPQVDGGHRLELTLDVVGLPVDEVVCSTHGIAVTETDNTLPVYAATLADTVTIPDRDFSATIRLHQQDAPHVRVLASREDDGVYALISLFPPIGSEAPAAPPPPRDVLFLIDTSGSMSGHSIAQAKNGLNACLDMLRDQDTFTMIRFSDTFSAFTRQTVAASAIHIDEARNWIASLDADGGTEMQPALAYALSAPRHAGALRMIVFLTDGDVGNEDALLALLADKLGAARLFTFGIGSAPNEFLMRRMAELGRGQSRFLRTDEDLEPVMADFFRTLEAPVCTDVALSWLDAAGRIRDDVECYPNPCPDVFADRPLQVVARLPHDYAGEVAVAGMLHGDPASFAFPIVPSKRTTTAISRLFGQQQVNRLMIDLLQAQGEPNKQAVRAQVVETALRHQLITQFTSRVAVEEVVERAPDGTRVTTRVAVPLPFGFEATATHDPLLAWVGGLLLAIAGAMGLQMKRSRA